MLKYEHVSLSRGRTVILRDINLTFRKGEITVLIGPNGCGKTTLLSALTGISVLESGRILLNGQDLAQIRSRERARQVAFLSQVHPGVPSLCVQTLVEHGRFPYLGFSRRKGEKDVEIVERAMKFCGIWQERGKQADTLSGGMRQRVFFAMVLAQDTPLIILDEPTTYLDIRGQRELFGQVRRLKEEGRTLILILHDLSQAVRISDSLVVMDKGKIVAQGSSRECLESGVISRVFETGWKRFSEDGKDYYFFE